MAVDDLANALKIVRGMGFPDDECGKYVTELRENIYAKVKKGLTGASGGTWYPGVEKLSYEDRAKAILAMDWELENGHGYRVEAFDGFIQRSYDLTAQKHIVRIFWRYLPAWLGDRFRQSVMLLRIFWNKSVLRKRNPYK